MALNSTTKIRLISGSAYILLPRNITSDSRFDTESFLEALEIRYHPTHKKIIIQPEAHTHVEKKRQN